MLPIAIRNAIITSQQIPRDGLVGWYMFDSGSAWDQTTSTVIYDHSGNNYTLGTYNSPTFVPAPHGLGLNLASAASQMATGSVSNYSMITRSFTVACWAYIRSAFAVGKYPSIVGKTEDYKGWNLYCQSEGGGGVIGTIGTGAAPWISSPLYSIPLNTWTHVAIRYDRTIGFSLWANGVSQGTTAAVNKDPVTCALPTIIGRHYSSAVYGYLNGVVDDVRIYNRDLSNFEMKLLIP